VPRFASAQSAARVGMAVRGVGAPALCARGTLLVALRSARVGCRVRSAAWPGLTPRSSGAPTAGHQARSGGTRYIFASPGLASCRRRPLSSNVRHRMAPPAVRLNTARPSGLASVKYRGTFGQFEGQSSPHASPHASVNFRYSPAAHTTSHAAEAATTGCPRHEIANSGCGTFRTALPNPSLKRSANGVPPGPACGALHSPQSGPGATPSSPA
jgi:hypothetical protein